MKLYENYNKIINLVITFIIVSVITILIKNYFQPFLIILILILITQPIYKFFLKINIPKSICAILSLLIVNLGIFMIVFYFGNTILEMF